MDRSKSKKVDRILLFSVLILLTLGTFGLLSSGTSILDAAAAEPLQVMLAELDTTGLTDRGYVQVAEAEIVPLALEEETFTASLTIPVSAAGAVTAAVNLNEAVFTVVFSEAVKNNGLNTGDRVTVVRSNDDTVVATASKDAIENKIIFDDMLAGSTSTTFTIPAAALEPSTDYLFILDGTITANTLPVKTLGSDMIYSFSTTADILEEPSEPFAAIALYPVADARDVEVGASMEIGFTEAVGSLNKISTGAAIQLMDVATSLAVPADFTVSTDGTVVSVDPVEELAYGGSYTLKIVDGQLKNAAGDQILSEVLIPFRTTSFSQVAADMLPEGNGADITISLTNGSAAAQKVYIDYVVRRDKGARLEDGGTVVLSAKTEQVSCAAAGETTASIKLADLSLDQFGNPLEGDIYLDLYIVNGNGNLLATPLHINAQ